MVLGIGIEVDEIDEAGEAGEVVDADYEAESGYSESLNDKARGPIKQSLIHLVRPIRMQKSDI